MTLPRCFASLMTVTQRFTPRSPRLALAIALIVLSSAVASADVVAIRMPENPSPPAQFGAAELERELRDAGHRVGEQKPNATIAVSEAAPLDGVKAPAKPESFAVRKLAGNRLAVVGSDATGAMYGLLEVAEQVSWSPGRGVMASVTETTQSPFKALRGVNPFIQVEPLRDPNSWFYSEDYWRGYTDLLARSRINWLDLHAMYSIISTSFPNVYPYLLKSAQYPDAGLPPAQAKRNLEMFQRIARMAHERGIKVGLMSYQASWDIPDAPKPSYEQSDDAVMAYTREMVRQIASQVPELDFIGFRIGESGRAEDFYEKTYLPALAESGRKDIALYTRTWIGHPEMIHRLGREYPGDFDIEIKYNGEQLGRPYQVVGERFAGWGSYSYQNYTSYPRDYWIVWQVRANGTHRIFKWGDPEFVRRTARSFDFPEVAQPSGEAGPASGAVAPTPSAGGVGFTLEPMDAYYPHTDYFHWPAVRHDYFRWIYQRDWFWNMLWGRLSYNPDCPSRVWVEAFERRFGDAGPDVLEMTTWMSRIVPLIYSAHCLGPDHRDMAPELETGGAIDTFGSVQAFDDSVISSPAEYAQEVLERRPSGRMSPLEVATLLLARAQKSLAAAEIAQYRLRYLPDSSPAYKEFDCLRMDAQALSHLAGYYAYKLRAAVELELFRRANHLPDLEAARAAAVQALNEWKALSDVTTRHYHPFVDTLRMHTTSFHWSKLTPEVEQDLRILDDMKAKFLQHAPAAGAPPLVGHVPLLRLEPGRALRVEATVLGAGEVGAVTLHYRSGRGGAFAALPMRREQEAPLYFAIVPEEATRGDRLEYYIEAQAGSVSATAPADGATAPYAVEISADSEPPALSELRASHAAGADRATISAAVSDQSALRSVRLFYKPMPSAAKWTSVAMEQRGGRCQAQVPVTPEGLLYYVRAVDAGLNASMAPDFLQETPYGVIPPWPLPGGPPPAGQINKYAQER